MSSSELKTINFQNMTKDNKQQKLSDSTDTAIAYSTCYAQPSIQLFHGNNIDVIRDLEDESIDVICIDPPYLYLKNQKLERPFDEHKFFSECKRLLTKNGFIILFGRGTSFYCWNTILADLKFTFKEEIVWDKRQVSSPMNSLSRRHETISIHTKGKGILNKIKIPFVEANLFEPHKIQEAIYRLTTTFGNRKTFDLVKKYYETGEYEYNEGKDRKFNATLQTNIKKTNRTLQFAITMEEGVMERSIISQTRDHFSAIHPTQKPVRLLERLLALVSPKNKEPKNIVVADFFGGSFSTMEAVYYMGMKGISCEIDKEYFDSGKNRIENLPPIQTSLF